MWLEIIFSSIFLCSGEKSAPRLPSLHVCAHTLLTLMNYCSFDLFSQQWQSVSKKICDLEEEKWGLAVLSGELAWVQFEMLLWDLSCSVNQKAGGGKSSGEMVIFMTAEPRVVPHSLGFLHFTCTVVLKMKPMSHFEAPRDSWKWNLSSVLCSAQWNQTKISTMRTEL